VDVVAGQFGGLSVLISLFLVFVVIPLVVFLYFRDLS